MKRHLFASLMVLSAVCTTNLAAQPYAGQTLALSQFLLVIDPEIVSQARFIDNWGEDIRLVLKGKDWLTDRLSDPVFELVAGELEAAWHVQVAPADTLQGFMVYTPYGYPSGSFKKAIRSGRADLYAKVIVNVLAGETRGSDLDVGNVYSREHQAIRPRIEVTLKVVDAQGDLVHKSKSKVRTQTFFRVTEHYLFEFPIPVDSERPDEDEQSATLLSLIADAVDQLLPMPGFAQHGY